MRINLNGTQCDTSAETLAGLLSDQGIDAETVATAVDGLFVPCAARADHLLVPGAKVEVLTPMQGG